VGICPVWDCKASLSLFTENLVFWAFSSEGDIEGSALPCQ
jgi:hypothetical protein